MLEGRYVRFEGLLGLVSAVSKTGMRATALELAVYNYVEANHMQCLSNAYYYQMEILKRMGNKRTRLCNASSFLICCISFVAQCVLTS
jgi:hypothetical protein